VGLFVQDEGQVEGFGDGLVGYVVVAGGALSRMVSVLMTEAS
jgi:hypothetical protein